MADRSEWNSCKRKARFRNEHDAERQAKKHGLRAYTCEACDGFHLTSMALRPAPRQRAQARPEVAAERARRALAELERKGVSGPLLDSARAEVARYGAYTPRVFEAIEWSADVIADLTTCEARARRLTLTIPLTLRPLLVYNDGGRAAAGVSQKDVEGDCAVRALAVCLTKTSSPGSWLRIAGNAYVVARQALLSAGARREEFQPGGAGVTGNVLHTAARILFSEVIRTGHRAPFPTERPREGAHIVYTAGHVAACIDGQTHDTWNSLRSRTRQTPARIYGWLTVVAPRPEVERAPRY